MEVLFSNKNKFENFFPAETENRKMVTWSQRRLARAWMHLPGHSFDSAVWVIVPSKPGDNPMIVRRELLRPVF
jgi:hypothetical protein